ncbi:hypothetical protein E4K10_15470 [Streptomyces sp. T1317-0309]|nr:hypothetical protein E4K10_15470 [Streptomyces sp. T1317-0309]
MADLDGDGTADRVLLPSRTGAGLTITFEPREGGARRWGHGSGRERGTARRTCSPSWRTSTGTAGVTSSSSPPARSRATTRCDRTSPSCGRALLGAGRGQSDHHVDLSEPVAIAVADYDHDRYPDLASYGHGVTASIRRRPGSAA